MSGDMAQQMAQLLLVSTLKTTVILLAALAALRLLRRSSASLRHWVLNLAFLGALVMPIISMIGPVWSLAVLPSAAQSAAATGAGSHIAAPPAAHDDPVNSGAGATPGSAAAGTPSTPTPLAASPAQTAASAAPMVAFPSAGLSAARAALLVWFAGVVVVFTRWLAQLRVIWRATHRANPADFAWRSLLTHQAQLLRINRQVKLVFSGEIQIPMTWGFWQPVIILPLEARGWDENRSRIVLRHELAHIARRDYLTQWVTLAACVLNWFNPLVWKALRRVTLEREQASDDLVLNSGVRSIEYAGLLLDIARSARLRPSSQMIGLTMAQRPDLEHRIRGILDQQRPRAASRPMRLAMLAALMTLLLPLGGMRLAAQADSITLSLAVETGLMDGISGTGILDTFEAAHPGVTVALVESAESKQVPDAADGADAYFSAMQQYANSADVLFFNDHNLALSPLATRAGYLLDLAPLVQADSEAPANDFYPQLWNAYQWDGGFWALPFGADLVLLDYDHAAFDRAGLTYPDGSWTLDQFVNAANALTVKDASGNVVSAGFANTGRIFREALWRSLFDADAVDASVLPNAPQFNRPDVESVIDAYHQLEQQGAMSGDASSAAMYVDFVRNSPEPNRDWALLPGGHGVLLPYGLAVSAGTEHPDLAYDLVKFLTAQSAIGFPIPARRSTIGAGGIASFVQQPYQALVQQAFDNSLTLSNLRFADYLNGIQWTTGSVQDALQNAQMQVTNDLQTADGKRSTLTVSISEPVAPTLPPGKIALNFDAAASDALNANRDQWNQVIQHFTANDPKVGLVNLRMVDEPASDAAAHADCFYMPTNAVPTMTDNSLLDLAPLLSADPNFDPNDFVSGVLAAVQRGNQTYALPVDIEPFILRYDSARFSAANLPMPTDQWTVSDFTDALNALKPSSQGQAPFVDTASGGAYLLVLIASYGGVPLDYRTNPPTVNFTAPANVDAIRQVLDLARSGDIRYTALGDFGQTNPAFPNNTTAIYPLMINDFVKPVHGGTPDVPVLFPHGNQFNGLAYNLGALYISSQAQSPEACYRFIGDVAQHPELFSAMPARRSLLSSPAFTAATNPDVLALYNDVDTLLQDPHTVPFENVTRGPASAADALFEHWLFQAFDSYVLNNGDLDAALQAAQTYATAFQGCIANLPPLDLSSLGKNGDMSAAIPYVDCAEQADNSLKPILDPLVGR